MARKTATCMPCYKPATETVELKVRVMEEHRDEWREVAYCPDCAAALRENGLAR